MPIKSLCLGIKLGLTGPAPGPVHHQPASKWASRFQNSQDLQRESKMLPFSMRLFHFEDQDLSCFANSFSILARSCTSRIRSLHSLSPSSMRLEWRQIKLWRLFLLTSSSQHDPEIEMSRDYFSINL